MLLNMLTEAKIIDSECEYRYRDDPNLVEIFNTEEAKNICYDLLVKEYALKEEIIAFMTKIINEPDSYSYKYLSEQVEDNNIYANEMMEDSARELAKIRSKREEITKKNVVLRLKLMETELKCTRLQFETFKTLKRSHPYDESDDESMMK